MDHKYIGWLTAIIIGAVAGWVADNIMKTHNNLLLNIVLGIIGALVANFIFGIVGIHFSGIIGRLIAGIIGACLLIFLSKILLNSRNNMAKHK